MVWCGHGPRTEWKEKPSANVHLIHSKNSFLDGCVCVCVLVRCLNVNPLNVYSQFVIFDLFSPPHNNKKINRMRLKNDFIGRSILFSSKSRKWDKLRNTNSGNWFLFFSCCKAKVRDCRTFECHSNQPSNLPFRMSQNARRETIPSKTTHFFHPNSNHHVFSIINPKSINQWCFFVGLLV